MKVNKSVSFMIDEACQIIGKKLPVFYLSQDFAETASMHYERFSKLMTPDILSGEEFIGIYIVMGTFIIYDYNEGMVTAEAFDVKSGIKIIDKQMVSTLIAFIMTMGLFKKYAEIETKVLQPKTKVGNTIKCKYINQTSYTITYLNSTWFTNLVKSDAFKVSGHFRLQPCHDENGLPTKKLIWINDFVKSGYTAPARKIKQAI